MFYGVRLSLLEGLFFFHALRITTRRMTRVLAWRLWFHFLRFLIVHRLVFVLFLFCFCLVFALFIGVVKRHYHKAKEAYWHGHWVGIGRQKHSDGARGIPSSALLGFSCFVV